MRKTGKNEKKIKKRIKRRKIGKKRRIRGRGNRGSEESVRLESLASLNHILTQLEVNLTSIEVLREEVEVFDFQL